MRRVLIIAGLLVVAGVGTASAYVVTGGINNTGAAYSPLTYVASDGVKSAVAWCPAGTVSLGGGYVVDPNYAFAPVVFTSEGVVNSKAHRLGWGILIGNGGSATGAFTVQALCGGHTSRAATTARATRFGSFHALASSAERKFAKSMR